MYYILEENRRSLRDFYIEYTKKSLKHITNTYISTIFKIEIVMDDNRDITILLKLKNSRLLKKCGISIDDINSCIENPQLISLLEKRITLFKESSKQNKNTRYSDFIEDLANEYSNTEIEYKYVNINTFHDMKIKHKFTNNYMNFGKRICKNEFMKNYLLTIYKNICPICKNIILDEKVTIHHIDYDNTCIYDTKNPDCGRCCEEHNDKFNQCIKCIVPVHKVCNAVIKKMKDNMG